MAGGFTRRVQGYVSFKPQRIGQAIGSIGMVVKVTPGDEILRGKGEHEFVDDKSPFKVRVTETLFEDGLLIEVIGPVVDA